MAMYKCYKGGVEFEWTGPPRLNIQEVDPTISIQTPDYLRAVEIAVMRTVESGADLGRLTVGGIVVQQLITRALTPEVVIVSSMSMVGLTVLNGLVEVRVEELL